MDLWHRGIAECCIVLAELYLRASPSVTCSSRTSKLSSMSRPTLLQSQTNALLTLLNLNQPTKASSSTSSAFPGSAANTNGIEDGVQGPLVWKVLILDDLSKDILATSLRVQDLREQGVTLHM